MARKSNKMQISIYQISDCHKLETENWDDMIHRIFSTNSEYSAQKLKKDKYENYKIRLYVCNEPPRSSSKVINFYEPIVEQGESLFEAKRQDVSTILLIYNETNMFAVTTGFAHSIVRNYADLEFGLKIMSGLIGEYDNIKSISDKGVVGSIIGNTRYFRGKYNWSDEDDFGKLFKEICAKLPRSAFVEKLGFSDDEVKKDVTCIGKTTFKINKTIGIDKLFNLVVNIESVLKSSKNIFNSMIPIYNRGADKGKYLVLTNALIKLIYDSMNASNKIEFDVSNTEFDTFYKADSYNIIYGNEKLYAENIESIDTLDFLFDLRSRNDVPMETLDDFNKAFTNMRICSYSPEEKELTNDTLLNHINGELKYDNKTYFIIDGMWLELKDEFVDRLNRECRDFLSKYYNNNLISAKWEGTTDTDENKFINLLCEKDKHFKIHPVKTSENIELCDSIFVKDDTTYMFFVKDGFDHCIRDLTSQAYISYRRLIELQKSGETSLICEYYDKIQKIWKTKFR